MVLVKHAIKISEQNNSPTVSIAAVSIAPGVAFLGVRVDFTRGSFPLSLCSCHFESTATTNVSVYQSPLWQRCENVCQAMNTSIQSVERDGIINENYLRVHQCRRIYFHLVTPGLEDRR